MSFPLDTDPLVIKPRVGAGRDLRQGNIACKTGAERYLQKVQLT